MTRHLPLYAAVTEEAETQSKFRLVRMTVLVFLFFVFFFTPHKSQGEGKKKKGKITADLTPNVAQLKCCAAEMETPEPSQQARAPQRRTPASSHVHTSGVT